MLGGIGSDHRNVRITLQIPVGVEKEGLSDEPDILFGASTVSQFADPNGRD
jgi:hypothetical protein